MLGKLLNVLKSIFTGTTSDASIGIQLFVVSCVLQLGALILFLKTEIDSAFYPKALNTLFIVTCYSVHSFSVQYVVLLRMFGIKLTGQLDLLIDQKVQIAVSSALLLSIASVFLLSEVHFFKNNLIFSITAFVVALTFGLYRGRHLYDDGDIA